MMCVFGKNEALLYVAFAAPTRKSFEGITCESKGETLLFESPTCVLRRRQSWHIHACLVNHNSRYVSNRVESV